MAGRYQENPGVASETWAPRSASVSARRASHDAALALAAFYGMGGVLCLISLIVPAWAGREEAIIVVVGILATVVACALPLTRRWLTRRACYVLVILGSFLIAALLYAGAGGAASATYAGFYVWVAVYSFLFFSPRAAAVQVLIALVSEALVLVQIGQAGPAPAQVIVSAGTILATGAVVGLLAAQMRTLTLTDELTGLPNRRALDVTLVDRLGRDRHRPAVAILGIDLDGFKALNDAFGHAAGDNLLREVAALWSSELRHGDALARIGGDEFIAVLNDCDDERARAVAARMIAVIPAPVSACVGLTVVSGSTEARPADIPHVLASVDTALYQGKAQGPGSIVVAVTPSPAAAHGIPFQARGPAA